MLETFYSFYSRLYYYLSPKFLLHTVPLHRWSSRRNNSHPLAMSSLNYVTWFWLKKMSVAFQHHSSITKPYDTSLVCCATVQQEEHFKKTMWSIRLDVDVVIPWALGISLFKMPLTCTGTCICPFILTTCRPFLSFKRFFTLILVSKENKSSRNNVQEFKPNQTREREKEFDSSGL